MIKKIKRRTNELASAFRLYVRRKLLKEILVIGDSHTKVFAKRAIRNAYPGFFFNVQYVPGATVSGLQNPKSKTQALPIFRESIRRSKAVATIVQLGEVDIGFVIWYRVRDRGRPLQEMVDLAIEGYKRFLDEVAKSSHVVCMSVPLPTIKDNADWSIGGCEKRGSVLATQRERTAVTLHFNNRMEAFCNERNFTFLSFDSESLGDNGLVRDDLLNPLKPLDPHYDCDKYADLIRDRLSAFTKSL